MAGLALRLLRALGLRSLEIEVKAHLPLLPGLRSQLQESAAEMEHSVVDVCQSFQNIAAEARGTVDGTSRVVGDGGSDGVDALIAEARSTIESLLERIERSSEVSRRAAEKMQGVESALNGVCRSLAEVDKIAFANRLLALNAKIESVHVGEAGAGFGLVADQITAHAVRSTAITDELSSTVSVLKDTILAAAGDLARLASEEREALTESRREAREAIDDFSRAHGQLCQALNDSRERSALVAQNVSRAVMGLQFQDRFAQRIGHVTSALEQMERSLARCLGGAAEICETTEARRVEIASSLEKACTMERERIVLAGGMDQAPAAGDDVELF